MANLKLLICLWIVVALAPISMAFADCSAADCQSLWWGKPGKVGHASIPIHASHHQDTPVLTHLQPDTPVRIVAEAKDWVQLETPGGFPVWVAQRYLDHDGVSGTITASGVRARSLPSADDASFPIGSFTKGDEVKVIEVTTHWVKVQGPKSLAAWTRAAGIAKLRHAVLFTDEFVETSPATGQTISDLLDRTEAVRENYLTELNDRKNFTGLYVRTELDHNLEGGEDEEAVALEWELFDEGWHESKKQLSKTKLETELQFLQLLRDMQEHQFNGILSLLREAKNFIRLHLAKKTSEATARLLAKYTERLDQGYATQEEYDKIGYQHARAQIEVDHYAGLDQSKLLPKQIGLLNMIEHVSLTDSSSLNELALANSLDLRIQDLFISRSEFFPEWLDHLSLRLYVGHEKQFGIADRENVLGFRLRAPLGFNRNRETLIGIEQSAYRDQQAAIRLRIAQKISQIMEGFRFEQKSIKLNTSEHELLSKQQNIATRRLQYPLSALPAVPDKSIDQLSMKLFHKEEETLLARLQAYEWLLRLRALVAPNQVAAMVTPQG